MNLYVWEYVDALTNNYHSGGGLVVIAGSVERAREMAMAKNVNFAEKELAPDIAAETSCDSEHCWIFPDAGCC